MSPPGPWWGEPTGLLCLLAVGVALDRLLRFAVRRSRRADGLRKWLGLPY